MRNSEAVVLHILTGSFTILIYMVHVTHLLAVLGTCEALVEFTPESSPEETKNKRDAKDYSGNNFGFGNLVICIVRKDKDIFSREREREGGERERDLQKVHGNSIPVTQ